jgi:hypothetical protein
MWRHDGAPRPWIDLHTRAGAQFPGETKYLVRPVLAAGSPRVAQRAAVELRLAFAAAFGAAIAPGKLDGNRLSTALSITRERRGRDAGSERGPCDSGGERCFAEDRARVHAGRTSRDGVTPRWRRANGGERAQKTRATHRWRIVRRARNRCRGTVGPRSRSAGRSSRPGGLGPCLADAPGARHGRCSNVDAYGQKST